MRILFPAIFASLLSGLIAEEVYESPSTFIASAFPGGGYETGTVSTRNEAVKAIFNGRGYRASSAKFWRNGERTAWILEEIGKHKPITVGVVIDKGKIDTLKVLFTANVLDGKCVAVLLRANSLERA